MCIGAPAFAGKTSVVTTYPWIASITEYIGKDRVSVFPLARADYDPHTIIPKPSYIAKLRGADLLIMNGAQLEIGWLPPLIRQANNPVVFPGERGFLDLSATVTLLDPRDSVSRAEGDIHPEGNPHFALDPYNIPVIAKAIAARLAELDGDNAAYYEANLAEFAAAWSARLAGWDARLSKLKGVKVIEYHRLFDYLLNRYGVVVVATIEPLPGIPPASRHIAMLEARLAADGVWGILQDVYHPDDASALLSAKFGLRLIVLPHDAGAVDGTGDIFALFEEITRRLAQ
ncbi:MAG: zinc ABC transporter substrate-binding protein [Spirochaetes bacterium]|nr:MAG: zinc ABC transporter substrate-binding protein [Spirochaetota bacterium]